MNLKHCCQLLDKTEYRDKTLKIIQNIFLLKSYFKNIPRGEPDLYHQLYSQIYITRRLMKLGKFLIMISNMVEHYQIQRIKIKGQRAQLSSKVNTFFIYAANFLFSLFHLTENVMVLQKIGFIKWNLKFRTVKTICQSFWALGLVAQMLYYVNKLTAGFKTEYDLRDKISTQEMTPKDFMDVLQQLSEERRNHIWNLVRIFGDFICALQQSRAPSYVVSDKQIKFQLGTNFNKGLIATGGIISSTLFVLRNKK